MLSPSQLQTLYGQFQSRYPMGCLSAELLTIHEGQFVVRALVHLAGTTLATAMAASPEIEAAEDRAKIRALEAVGFGLGASSAFTYSASGSLLANLPLDSNQPQKGSSFHQAQSSDSFHPPEEANVLKATRALPHDPTSNKEPKPAEKPISAAQSLGSLNQVTSDFTETSTDRVASLDHSDLPALSNPAIGSSTLAGATVPESGAVETNFARASFTENDFAATEEMELAAETNTEPKTAVGTTRASKAEKPSKRKAESFELPPVSAPPRNTADRSEEIMKIGIEMKRLGWSTEQGREYLKRTYGKRSRQELDDAELLDFLHYLEGQPSPLQTPF